VGPVGGVSLELERKKARFFGLVSRGIGNAVFESQHGVLRGKRMGTLGGGGNEPDLRSPIVRAL